MVVVVGDALRCVALRLRPLLLLLLLLLQVDAVSGTGDAWDALQSSPGRRRSAESELLLPRLRWLRPPAAALSMSAVVQVDESHVARAAQASSSRVWSTLEVTSDNGGVQVVARARSSVC